jgi:hypothetical protein
MRLRKMFIALFLLGITLIIDVFMALWKRIKKQELFPGA